VIFFELNIKLVAQLFVQQLMTLLADRDLIVLGNTVEEGGAK